MTDMRDDISQGAERIETEAIQVLVLSPDNSPRLQTIENRRDALEALAGGPFTTFSIGVDHTDSALNADSANLSLTSDRALGATSTSIPGEFVFAG